ncbi:hypothetical protein L195_g059390, partial [Trifolium pratense]
MRRTGPIELQFDPEIEKKLVQIGRLQERLKLLKEKLHRVVYRTVKNKNTVLSALKENPYSGSEAQCPNLHLSHFYEACDYTDPPG